VGGYDAQLNLNNAGDYFDSYFVTHGDVAAAEWLQSHYSGRLAVYTDLSGKTVLQSETALRYAQGLYPGLTPPVALLFVRLATPKTAKSTIVWENETVSYTYPVNCLGTGRPVLFRSQDREVLGPVPSRSKGLKP
jgi:hypothetical protein